ncbi:hypothetical protein P171DRAFT_436665 [Karstenula rhodostoma CBS 690.94]|uniref:Uncharacterized protein n=1 Tax=Karstenula rhodostoma CBS 690.94 TaxID=1392251 RepID=A0A9P4U642_9PLEO|nr:hypothetical protein P171DRAFT_436665 [Karstenula rhodostoma CBS 690.94]
MHAGRRKQAQASCSGPSLHGYTQVPGHVYGQCMRPLPRRMNACLKPSHDPCCCGGLILLPHVPLRDTGSRLHGTLSGKPSLSGAQRGGRQARPDGWRGETHSWMTTWHKQRCGVQLIVLRQIGSHHTGGLSGTCDSSSRWSTHMILAVAWDGQRQQAACPFRSLEARTKRS